MKVLSVNVSVPREVQWRDDVIATAIHKSPVEGRIAAKRLNLDGDRQADLAVHGGPEKAIYAYPIEHYAYWREELPGVPLRSGVFGENLTIEGLVEPMVRVGDILRIGTTELVVTQPRMPCFKLNARFQRGDMVKRFLRSGRSGFYLAVLQEGHLGAGDAIALSPSREQAVTVADVAALYTTDRHNQDLLHRAIGTPALPEAWREHFRVQLSQLGAFPRSG